jgi:chromosomal replication initiator protein
MDPRAPDVHRALYQALRARLGDERAGEWLRLSRVVTLDESAAVIAFPDDAARTRLEEAGRAAVARALQTLTNRNLRVVFAVEPAFFPAAAARPAPPPPVRAAAASDRAGGFDTLIAGPSNRLAVQAARRFAETGGAGFRTLLLAGPPGSGRTRLLLAVHHACLTARRGAGVLYLPVERFHRQFVFAVQRGLLEPFRRKYRAAAVLLVDDVHLLGAKPRTQEEFLHTYDTLLDHGAALAMTADRPADAIEGLSRALRDRLRAALEVRIEAPDPAVRMAWLRARAAEAGFACPDDALARVAEQVRTGFHDLARCLELMRADGGDARSRAERAVEAVRRAWGESVTVEEIARRVADHYGLKLADLHGGRRTRGLVEGRGLCFYLARRHTPMTLAALGAALGGRDHATVHLAIRGVERRMKEDRDFERLVGKLEASLPKA